ncbi:hypothetical protein [Rhodococcus sp. NPDC049939]|uniref:hypothetical protein n=1 Tax=Rhodococcus sp. NPDC049939 TaxID=3155511 RepID=UPI00340971FF
MKTATDLVVPTESELAELVGTPFPGGTVRLERWWVHLVLDSMMADTKDGAEHPVFVFLVATSAMGWSWDELFAVFGARESDGPMAGETETTIRRPLRADETYTVFGEIVSAQRKVGKQTGVFDIVGYRLDLYAEDGALSASTTNSIVFPRRGVAS